MPVLAVLVAGLALAPMFPTIIGVTFSQYAPGKHGSSFGIVLTLGLLGPTIIPELIGSLSFSLRVQRILLIAAAIAAPPCAASVLMGRARRPRSSPDMHPQREQATVLP